MKIVLTGSYGNLGSAILEQCTHEIVRLDREEWRYLDEIMSDDIDIVVHAAYDLKKGISDYPIQVLDSNIMTTARLIESMHKNKVGRIVFISTCAVYGESMNTNEDIQCCPISVNGIVKLLNEKMIADYCTKHSIKYQIYRVFNTFGGKDHFSILSHLRNSLETKTAFQLNNYGLSQRDFIHVSDVAKIILMLIDQDHDYSYLNLGTGRATKICDIVDIVKDKYPDLIIKHCKATEAEYSRADISRLQTLLDYSFIDVKDFIGREFIV